MMRGLRDKLDTSIILITHDLGVVADFCDSVAVTYAGEIVESGTVEHIFDHPSHPYTEGLFNSLPKLDSKERRLKPIKGLMPDPSIQVAGCRFSDRCPYADAHCAEARPEAVEVQPGHLSRCFRAQGEVRT